MNVQWIGAILMISACGGIGFAMALYDRRELCGLRQLQRAVEYMQCELTCRLTPLPGLLRKAAIMCKGTLQAYFNMLAEELENQIAPDVSCCVEAALDRCGELPQKVRQMLKLVGQTLGRFDLDGQIKGLENTYRDCERICSEMEVNRPQRLRSYPTLGLCIGVVLAILFL